MYFINLSFQTETQNRKRSSFKDFDLEGFD